MSDTIDISQCVSLVQEELKALQKFIQSQLKSDVALVNQLAHYIIGAKGKRLRPVTLFLINKAIDPDKATSSDAIALGAVIEMIHTATLLHDDVVDESSQRRGKETANSIFGNAAPVLVGDYLYSKSFQIMVQIGNIPAMRILSDATNHITEGEVMQLVNCGDANITEQQYFAIIKAKTAILFQAAAQIGYLIEQPAQDIQTNIMQYGMHLGTAFQVVDDILDYQAHERTMGKNLGDDLSEGKITLPLIHALQHANQTEKEVLLEAIEAQDRTHFNAVLEIINCHNSLEYSKNKAQEEADKAINALSGITDNPFKQALINLAKFSIQRVF